MVAEMKAAIATQQPMLMMFWHPHWIHAEIELNLVEWDKSVPECDSLTQKRGDACGFSQAKVNKIVSRDFEKTWPKAYAMLGKYALTNKEQNALIKKVDQDGIKVEDVVAEWINANEAVWKPWTE